MREYLLILLPIGCALVATLIAMILCKTSYGLFAERVQKKSATCRIRLILSAVIASVAFLGMAKSTPERVMVVDNKDEVNVQRLDIRRVAIAFARLKINSLNLKAAQQVRVPGTVNLTLKGCVQQLETCRRQ